MKSAEKVTGLKLCLLLLTTITHAILATIESISYQDLSESNVCLEEASCLQRYADRGYLIEDARSNISERSFSKAKDARLFEFPCFCDEDCFKYGDCCHDASAIWQRSSTSQSSENNMWQCLPLRHETFSWTRQNTHVYMAARCPLNWEDEYYIRLCERIDIELYHYTLDIPVFSMDTNITYANLYCAVCHDDDRNLAEWTAAIECDKNLDEKNLHRFLQEAEYTSEELSWNLNVTDGQVVQCQLTAVQTLTSNHIQQEQVVFGPRCLPAITHCPPQWNNTEDATLCSNYTLYVIDSSNQVYRNPHCLKCNYKDVDTMDCISSLAHFHRSATNTVLHQRGISINALFNFKVKSGDIVGLIRKCTEGFVWNPTSQKCVQISCGPGQQYSSRNCVVQSREVNNGLNTSLISFPCHRINFTVDDITFIGNDINVNSTGMVYSFGTYEIVDDVVQICAENPLETKYTDALNIFSTVCLSTSIICLLLHVIIHMLIPKLRNLPGKNLLSLSICLLVAQFLYVTMVTRSEIPELCVISAVLIHWFYLASFFWMNVMSYDIYRTFSGPQYHQGRRIKTFYLYSCYAYGVPTLLILIGLTLDFASSGSYYSPQYGQGICFITNPVGLLELFVVPAGILLLGNIFLFSYTVYVIGKQTQAARMASRRRSKSSTKSKRPITKAQENRNRLVLYVKLAVITGIGWSFGFLSELLQSPPLDYLFVAFNGLQGTYIFIAFDLKSNIIGMLLKLITKKEYASLSKSMSSSRQRSSATRTTSYGTEAAA